MVIPRSHGGADHFNSHTHRVDHLTSQTIAMEMMEKINLLPGIQIANATLHLASRAPFHLLLHETLSRHAPRYQEDSAAATTHLAWRFGLW